MTDDFQKKALKVIQMNHYWDQGNERMAMSDEFNNCFKELSEAVPEDFKSMLRLLIQCRLFGVVIMDDEKIYIRQRAKLLMIDWDGIGWDLFTDGEER